jgi:hypothetical protein
VGKTGRAEKRGIWRGKKIVKKNLEKKLRVMVGYCMNKITPTNEIDKFNIDG